MRELRSTMVALMFCFFFQMALAGGEEEKPREIKEFAWAVCLVPDPDKFEADPLQACKDKDLLSKGRHLITAGTKLRVVATYKIEGTCDLSIKPRFEEKKRDTRLKTDFKEFVNAVKSQVNIRGEKACLVTGDHVLREDRATVIVEVNRGESNLASGSFLTGPREGWYLSLDLPVRNTCKRMGSDLEPCITLKHERESGLETSYYWSN